VAAVLAVRDDDLMVAGPGPPAQLPRPATFRVLRFAVIAPPPVKALLPAKGHHDAHISGPPSLRQERALIVCIRFSA